MDRSLARLSLGIAIASALCLSLPVCEGRTLAATVTAKDNAKAKKARQFYKEGNYEGAAKAFFDLSIEYPDNLVFTRNLGACYYYLRRPEPALSNLREYLKRRPDITKEDRSEVEGWMAEMEKLRDQNAAGASAIPAVAVVPPPATAPAPAAPPLPAAVESSAPAVAPPPVLPPVATAPPTPAPAKAVAVADTVSLGAGPAKASHRMRVAGIACGAVGLASMAVGVYFSTRVSSLSDSITTSDTPNASDYQSGKTAQTMQWVFYGVGAAAVATGSMLYYLGWRVAAPGRIAVAPMVGPGIAGLSAEGVF